MSLDWFQSLLAAPLVCILLIPTLCVFAMQKTVPTGIRIPMMRTRPEPLSNSCSSPFTVYLRANGRLSIGSRTTELSRGALLSQIEEARDSIQDGTIFVIAAPDVPYSEFAALIADMHNAAPPDRIAVVTRAAQIPPPQYPSTLPFRELSVDSCRFEWPAVAGQPKWPTNEPIPLPGDRISVWKAIFRKSQ
jgi:biopolymer transport protein ExbD